MKSAIAWSSSVGRGRHVRQAPLLALLAGQQLAGEQQLLRLAQPDVAGQPVDRARRRRTARGGCGSRRSSRRRRRCRSRTRSSARSRRRPRGPRRRRSVGLARLNARSNVRAETWAIFTELFVVPRNSESSMLRSAPAQNVLPRPRMSTTRTSSSSSARSSAAPELRQEGPVDAVLDLRAGSARSWPRRRRPRTARTPPWPGSVRLRRAGSFSLRSNDYRTEFRSMIHTRNVRASWERCPAHLAAWYAILKSLQCHA